jgi:transposase
MRPIGSAPELERRRRRVVALVEQGESPTLIANIVDCSRSSVYRWMEQAASGQDGLKAKPHPGRKRELTSVQHKKLEKHLCKGACAHGWTNDLWTADRVTELIRRKFGKRFHVEHVRKIVKERLGWTSQKPERRARERDEKEIERWKGTEFRRIKKHPA